MATFEFNNNHHHDGCEGCEDLNPRRLREECIIAFKVYDACRKQDCLTDLELGPARAAECTCIGDKHYTEGEVIDPPNILYSIL